MAAGALNQKHIYISVATVTLKLAIYIIKSNSIHLAYLNGWPRIIFIWSLISIYAVSFISVPIPEKDCTDDTTDVVYLWPEWWACSTTHDAKFIPGESPPQSVLSSFYILFGESLPLSFTWWIIFSFCLYLMSHFLILY